MVQTSFLIPLKDQFTQDLHPYTKFEELEKDLLLMFGGWTSTGIVRGCWKDPDTNKEIYERSRKYVIAVKKKDVNKLREYLKNKAKTMFGQKSIYFEIAGKVEFL
ncbi:hypothetical protein J7J45_03825 [Candidatus Aerophobetes bacterium]|nr:hypothetical protein [Candidatus Aerophobetes bacterium]